VKILYNFLIVLHVLQFLQFNAAYAAEWGFKMAKFKKIICLATLLALIVTVFAGCHQQNEIAMTIGDIQIKSSTYLCALLQADMQARSTVNTNLKNAGESTDAVEYYKQTIEDTDYSTYVKNKAIDSLREYAAVLTKYQEGNMELDEDTLSTIEQYSKYYWDSYGYSKYYEPNGVSYETFKDFFAYSYKSSDYFTSIYGKDGTEPVAEDEVTTALYTNFQIVDELQGSLKDSSGTAISDNDKAVLTAQMQAYADSFSNDGKSFETLYMEYNNTTEGKETTTDGAADPYATIIGTTGTSYESSMFDEVLAMEVGTAKVITDDSNITMVVKRDIKGDAYYADSLYNSAVAILKQDDYNTMITDFGAGLALDENTWATNRFKVKNIIYPTSSN